ncbi:MAG: hypothetical protein K8R10_09625 [Rhodocyclales bacterium]|jgi:hypothetical protein|nr:hypothetical protein [Rhodocyclales bacterium]
MKISYGLILLILAPLLASCDQLGIDTPAAEAAREEAEGKAIGSACRQSGRVLEDCYQINRRAPKAAIFTGWRDMDAYMRENKIPEIKPDSPAAPVPEKTGSPESAKEGAAPEAQKPVQKTDVPAVKSAPGKDAKAPEAKAEESPPARRARPALAR